MENCITNRIQGSEHLTLCRQNSAVCRVPTDLRMDIRERPHYDGNVWTHFFLALCPHLAGVFLFGELLQNHGHTVYIKADINDVKWCAFWNESLTLAMQRMYCIDAFVFLLLLMSLRLYRNRERLKAQKLTQKPVFSMFHVKLFCWCERIMATL